MTPPFATSFDASCLSQITATGLPPGIVFDVSIYFNTNYYNYNTVPNAVYFVEFARAWRNTDPTPPPYPYSKKFMSGAIMPSVPGGASGTLALTNLTPADFPLRIYMQLSGSTETSPPAIPPDYYYFETNMECTSMQVFPKSGPGISDEYTNFGTPTILWATNSFA
jgi:hypothetical protein